MFELLYMSLGERQAAAAVDASRARSVNDADSGVERAGERRDLLVSDLLTRSHEPVEVLSDANPDPKWGFSDASRGGGGAKGTREVTRGRKGRQRCQASRQPCARAV